jgi:hypothetical protein
VFTVNEHLDNLPVSNNAAEAVLDAAAEAGVPVVSARQLGEWETARATASNAKVTATGTSLTWTLVRPPAHAMELVPARWGTKSLRSLTVGGHTVPVALRTINGLPYALVGDATGGQYTARYG